MEILKPQNPPKPKGITFRHYLMKVHGADDHLTPIERREKRLEQMRRAAKGE